MFPAITDVGMRTWLLPVLPIAAMLAWLGQAFAKEQRANRDRLRGKSRVVETRCGPIEYAEIGSGPTVLVVHGAGGGFDQGMEFAEPIAKGGFHVVAMSRFGYLQTPMPVDASPAAQADAHVALLDALGIRRAAVLGASAGAPSAMQFALRHPDRCWGLGILVPMAFRPLTDPVVMPSHPAQKLLMFLVGSDFVFWMSRKLARNLLIKTVLGTPPDVVDRASLEEQARVDRMLRIIQPIAPRRLGIRNDARIANTLERYELEKITTPTLVVSVHDDLYGTYPSAQYTARQISGARFVGYDRGGHLWVGHHKGVIAEILTFLASASGAALTG
jgi:pimeloyl-ACP methyl ester carboxylesterase